MAAHFKNCGHCSAILDGTKNVVKLIGDGKAFELPANSSRRFYGKLDQYLAARKSKNPRS